MSIRDQEKNDIRVLSQTREGARFLCRLFEMCGVFRLSYRPGDTHATAFNEGQRNIGLAIYADIDDMRPIESALIEREVQQRDEMETNF